MESVDNRSALLLIDMQEDFLSPSGRMPVNPTHVAQMLEASQRAVASAETEGDLVIRIGNEFPTRDVIGNLLRRRAALKGSHGAVWDSRIWPPDSHYVAKWKANAFSNPDLGAMIDEHQIRKVRLAGLFARACVSSTALGAQRRGLRVQVIGGATACRSDRSRAKALDRLRRRGIEIV